MAQHNDLGRWGEDIAAEYLVQRGYKILERNWKSEHKEVDIIATDGYLLLFVEVKTRQTAYYGNPYEAVDWRKRKNLMTAMRRYWAMHGDYSEARFDIISIIGTPSSYTIEQYENAVSNFTY